MQHMLPFDTLMYLEYQQHVKTVGNYNIGCLTAAYLTTTKCQAICQPKARFR